MLRNNVCSFGKHLSAQTVKTKEYDCPGKETGHIQKAIGKCTIASRHKMLNEFINARCDDHETKKAYFSADVKRLVFQRQAYEYAKDEIFREMGQLADKMMKGIKGHGNTRFTQQRKQDSRKISACITGQFCIHQGISKDEADP